MLRSRIFSECEGIILFSGLCFPLSKTFQAQTIPREKITVIIQLSVLWCEHVSHGVIWPYVIHTNTVNFRRIRRKNLISIVILINNPSLVSFRCFDYFCNGRFTSLTSIRQHRLDSESVLVAKTAPSGSPARRLMLKLCPSARV